MKCSYHPDAEAVTTCSSCGRAICNRCATDWGGRFVCRTCLETANVPVSNTRQLVRPNHPLAVLSLALGVLGIAGCLCGGGIGGILLGGPAAFLGYRSRTQLKDPMANQEGLTFATIGMGLGVAEVSPSVIALLCLGGVYGAGTLTGLLEQLLRVQ